MAFKIQQANKNIDSNHRCDETEHTSFHWDITRTHSSLKDRLQVSFGVAETLKRQNILNSLEVI